MIHAALAAVRWLARAALLASGLALASPPAAATSLRYCDAPPVLDARQQDRLLRFAALIRRELEASGQAVALVARSGLDLDRFAVRYSHAGVSLRASPNTPWSVRQLYFACEERAPRLYDQGLAGFVQGTNDAELGYVSVLLLDPADAAALQRTALDPARALQLLGGTYSANAYPFDITYQNCNQWLAELLAAAWGGVQGAQARQDAQRWLQAAGYEPQVFEVGSAWLMLAGAFVPWLHSGDHPEADIAQRRYRVSMPASIEAFVRRTRPGAQRLEFCHTATQAVVRRGWTPIADGCVAGAGDSVIDLR